MLYLMILILFSNAGYVTNKNVGSTLFYNLHAKYNCWNEEDIAKLRARRAFDELLTPQIIPDRVNTKFIKDILVYYREAVRYVDHIEDSHTASILKDALYDTIGGNLKCEILPLVRFAYYAGYIPYRNARKVHNLYDDTKAFLNTQGLGWKRPPRIPQWSNLTVAKIIIGTGKLLDPCACLVTKRDSDFCIHLPSPKLDDNNAPSAIALPFKTNGLVSLESPSAENILLKYYTTASRCILQTSPKKCRHSDFVNFNNGLWHWMKRDVAPHLVDEKLYAAYGGVLRIAAAVQNYGRALSRRNLFEHEDLAANWKPWKVLTDSYIYIDKEWSPKLCIFVVILAAIVIYLLQICYNYILGDSSGCHCAGDWKKPFSKVACAEVEHSTPLEVPHQSAVFFSEKNRNVFSKSKPSSLGSTRTQKVYDLNENTEKFMAVIMSDNENEEEDSESSESKTDSNEDSHEKEITHGKSDPRPKSPPKIETSMAQLKINKNLSSSKQQSMRLYSTSTLTCSDATFCQRQQFSESAWSGTGSSTSGRSGSSSSTKSQSRRSRCSRDLAWARHVIAKRSLCTKTTSGTDLNLNTSMRMPTNR